MMQVSSLAAQTLLLVLSCPKSKTCHDCSSAKSFQPSRHFLPLLGQLKQARSLMNSSGHCAALLADMRDLTQH